MTSFDMAENVTPSDLARMLCHGQIDIRWRAARLLGSMGSDTVEVLADVIHSRDSGTRILAAWALGRTGDSRAVEVLSAAFPDTDELVAIALEGALSRLTTERKAISPGSGIHF